MAVCSSQFKKYRELYDYHHSTQTALTCRSTMAYLPERFSTHLTQRSCWVACKESFWLPKKSSFYLGSCRPSLTAQITYFILLYHLDTSCLFLKKKNRSLLMNMILNRWRVSEVRDCSCKTLLMMWNGFSSALYLWWCQQFSWIFVIGLLWQ